jgi:hypothetical protein
VPQPKQIVAVSTFPIDPLFFSSLIQESSPNKLNHDVQTV